MYGRSDMPKLFVQKLNADTYYTRSNKVEVLLHGRGLWGFVEKTNDDGLAQS